MRGRHSSALSSGQGRGIDSLYLSGDDSTAEHVDPGALHHGQYTPELSADTQSYVSSSYASLGSPNIIRPSEPRVELRLRVVQCFDERLRTVVQEHDITTPIEPTTWMQLLLPHLRPSVPPPPDFYRRSSSNF
ncbi:hypothetical protein Dimus_019942 [Dionaea muscipula]